jgi:hypothetical protein
MKNKIIFLLMTVISADIYSANILSNKSPITNVTVFKDRAFIKRKQLISANEGSYSIQFQNLTPLLDKESIKVKVSNPELVEILGIRTQKVFLKRSQNKELLKLKAKKSSLNLSIRKISSEIEDLVKEHSDLKILMNHYNESFTLNLHTKKWSKEKFGNFIKFMSNRSKKMHSKWKKSFLKYINYYDELNFVNNKIYELNSVSDLENSKIFVDVTIPQNIDNAWLEIQYLVTNVGWSPIYDIRIKNKSAIIEQHALIWQKTGEDWNNVKIRLSNIRSELNPKIPSISSYTLSYQEVKKVKTTIKNKLVDVKNMNQGSFNNENVEGMANFFDIKSKQVLKDGMQATKIFIQKKKTTYSENLELVGNQFPHVFKKGQLKNTFPFTLTRGPVSIYYNNEFIQNSTLNTIVTGKTFSLNTGIDHDIIVSRWHKNKTSKKGIVNQDKEYKREFITSLKNYSSKSKKLKVLEQIPSSELDAVNVSSEGSSTGLLPIKESPSWHYWNVTLKPREHKELNLTLKVKTPNDFQFQWPR